MSKLKVNEIESNTASEVKVLTELKTEAGLTNVGGVVSLGTQSAFSSTGIDDNATSTKLVVQDGSPNVNVTGNLTASGTINAADVRINGTSVSDTGVPKLRSSGIIKITGNITNYRYLNCSTREFLGTPYNATNLNTGSSTNIQFDFNSDDFDGADAIPMLTVSGVWGSSNQYGTTDIVSIAMSDTTISFSLRADQYSANFNDHRIRFAIFA